ncbi:MAG: Do family serine endopeptidase [Desulfobacterales bacterium]|nr:Do family serine endopeptidase [Desulfobacterales bacterium]
MTKFTFPTGSLIKAIFGVLIITGLMMMGSSPYVTSAAGAKPGKAGLVPESFTELAENASPAVVNIRTVKTIEGGGRVFRHFFQGPRGRGDMFDEFFKKFFDEDPREFKQKSLGSGFILDKSGYIVTNHHVIKDAEEIQVKLKNGNEYDAEIKGADSSTDLALIKIKAEEELPTLKLGSSENLKIGQWIIAIGNPFGLEHTVTAGIVSAKGRVIGAGPYDDFIQTDASINPGNSGGPLINMDGEVVGISTAIVAGGDGIGFAIPISMAKDIVSQLKKTGEVTRGWLGVGIQDLDSELKEYYNVDEGVLVTQVFPGDPADKAGIKPRDVILSVNGQSVDSARELSKVVADLSVGEAAKIKINRKGDIKTIKVDIAKRDEDKIAASMQGEPYGKAEDELGIEVSNISPNMAERFNLDSRAGVIVVNVAADSKAGQAGIRKGDIIKEINHQPVESVSDYEAIVEEVAKGETLQFYIKRAQRGYIVIKMAK